MKPSEVGELLEIIKAYWQEQSTDDATLLHWAELLEPRDFNAAKHSIRQRARQGMDRPSAAMVYAETLDYEGRQQDQGKTHRLLKPPEHTAEQAEKFKKILRETADRIAEKMGRKME